MGRFEQLIEDLGKEIGVPLTLDNNFACLLSVDDHLNVQLEYSENSEEILIICLLGEISPGKYREQMLQNALIVNSDDVAFGILSYLYEFNQMISHQSLPLRDLDGDRLAGYLSLFIEKAYLWAGAIRSGISPKDMEKKGTKGSSIFDLKNKS